MAVAYDYCCDECKRTWEEYHDMIDHPSITCEKCGKPARRIYKVQAIQFNGNGFYTNDKDKR